MLKLISIFRLSALSWLVLLLIMAGPAVRQGTAAVVKAATGLSLGYEWYERKYDTETSSGQEDQGTITTTTEDLTNTLDDSYSRMRITPLIDIERITARDSLKLQYKPSYRYDLQTYDHDIDHRLQVSLSRYITQNWQFNLNDDLLVSDIVEEREEEEIADTDSLSDNDGRRQYLKNVFTLSSSYTYWEESTLAFYYTYTLLENLEDDFSESYQNYDKHSFLLSAIHRFDSNWKVSLSSGYVRGLFDEQEQSITAEVKEIEDDLEELRLAVTLHNYMVLHQPLGLSYRFYGVDFDDPLKSSSVINDFTVDWQWNYSKRMTISLGAGPSYAKTDGQDGEWGYNGTFGFQYNLEGGHLRLSGDRGYARQNFSGTDENGLQEYWQLRADVQYQVFQDIALSAHASYRNEDQERIVDYLFSDDTSTESEYLLSDFNREMSRIGVALNYSFLQWYSLEFSYNFTHQTSERENESYEEHRFFVTLNFSKDILNM